MNLEQLVPQSTVRTASETPNAIDAIRVAMIAQDSPTLLHYLAVLIYEDMIALLRNSSE